MMDNMSIVNNFKMIAKKIGNTHKKYINNLHYFNTPRNLTDIYSDIGEIYSYINSNILRDMYNKFGNYVYVNNITQKYAYVDILLATNRSKNNIADIWANSYDGIMTKINYLVHNVIYETFEKQTSSCSDINFKLNVMRNFVYDPELRASIFTCSIDIFERRKQKESYSYLFTFLYNGNIHELVKNEADKDSAFEVSKIQLKGVEWSIKDSSIHTLKKTLATLSDGVEHIHGMLKDEDDEIIHVSVSILQSKIASLLTDLEQGGSFKNSELSERIDNINDIIGTIYNFVNRTNHRYNLDKMPQNLNESTESIGIPFDDIEKTAKYVIALNEKLNAAFNITLPMYEIYRSKVVVSINNIQNYLIDNNYNKETEKYDELLTLLRMDIIVYNSYINTILQNKDTYSLLLSIYLSIGKNVFLSTEVPESWNFDILHKLANDEIKLNQIPKTVMFAFESFTRMLKFTSEKRLEEIRAYGECGQKFIMLYNSAKNILTAALNCIRQNSSDYAYIKLFGVTEFVTDILKSMYIIADVNGMSILLDAKQTLDGDGEPVTVDMFNAYFTRLTDYYLLLKDESGWLPHEFETIYNEIRENIEKLKKYPDDELEVILTNMDHLITMLINNDPLLHICDYDHYECYMSVYNETFKKLNMSPFAVFPASDINDDDNNYFRLPYLDPENVDQAYSDEDYERMGENIISIILNTTYTFCSFSESCKDKKFNEILEVIKIASIEAIDHLSSYEYKDSCMRGIIYFLNDIYSMMNKFLHDNDMMDKIIKHNSTEEHSDTFRENIIQDVFDDMLSTFNTKGIAKADMDEDDGIQTLHVDIDDASYNDKFYFILENIKLRNSDIKLCGELSSSQIELFRIQYSVNNQIRRIMNQVDAIRPLMVHDNMPHPFKVCFQQLYEVSNDIMNPLYTDIDALFNKVANMNTLIDTFNSFIDDYLD